MGYITVKNAVLRTGKSPSTITRWCNKYEGTEHVKRKGRKLLISRTFLNKLVANKNKTSTGLVTNHDKQILAESNNDESSEESKNEQLGFEEVLKKKLQYTKESTSIQAHSDETTEDSRPKTKKNELLETTQAIVYESQKWVIKSLEEKNEYLSQQLEEGSQQVADLKQQVLSLEQQLREKSDEQVSEIGDFFTERFDEIQSVLYHQTSMLNALRTEQEQTFQLLPIPLKQEAIKVTPAVDGEGFTIEDHKLMKLLLPMALVLVFIHYIKGHIFIPFSIPYWQETRGIRLLLVSIITSWWCTKTWKHFKSDFRKAWRIFLFFWKV